MKKRFALIAVAVALMGAVIAFAERTGWGDRISVTDTPQVVGSSPGFGGYTMSVVNEGSNTVYCLVNCNNLAEFTNRFAAGTTVEIPSGDTFAFTTYGKTVLRQLFIRAGAGETNAVLLAVY